MGPRVALATCAALPDLDGDGPALLAALEAVGVEPRAAVWDDPAHDWAAYDLVVVRSTWDYTLRLQEFLAWCARVPRLANPAGLVRWNCDKRYLRDLAAAGVPVVPTTWLEPGDRFEPPAGEYVVKPVVSAGARDTARYGPPDASAARAHAEALLSQGRPVMVQPYQVGVDAAGETALLFFDGAHSHSARKAPLLRVGEGVRPDILGRYAVTPAVATAAQVAVARGVLAALPAPALYARVDLVPGPDGQPLLLELEVTEPGLFLSCDAASPDRFARAVLRAATPTSR